MKSSRSSFALLLFVGASLLTASMFAQTQSGSPSANVIDPSAPIQNPNATTSKPAIEPGSDMPAAPTAAPASTEATEAANEVAAKFAKFDRDADGRVTLAEFTAGYTAGAAASTHEAGAQPGSADAPALFKDLDGDHDSFLSPSELADVPAAKLKK